MIYIKKPEEIRIMREGGRCLNKILSALLAEVKPGIHTADLEDLAMR